MVSVASGLDFETAQSHEIIVKATDSGGLSNTWIRTITVSDVNDAPDVANSLSVTGPENTDIAIGRSRFESVFQDQDAGDALVSVRIDSVPAIGRLMLGDTEVAAGGIIAGGDLDSLAYRPVTDFGGDVAFTFSVSDARRFRLRRLRSISQYSPSMMRRTVSCSIIPAYRKVRPSALSSVWLRRRTRIRSTPIPTA